MGDIIDHRRRKSVAEVVAACASAVGFVPQRSPGEIQTVVQSAGLALEDIDPHFWRHVRLDWLDGSQDDEPFWSDGANEEYRFLAAYRGLLVRCLACTQPARPSNPFCSLGCAELWGRAKRACFAAPPLAMPEEEYDTLIALIGGAQPDADAVERLRRFLDGG